MATSQDNTGRRYKKHKKIPKKCKKIPYNLYLLIGTYLMFIKKWNEPTFTVNEGLSNTISLKDVWVLEIITPKNEY